MSNTSKNNGSVLFQNQESIEFDGKQNVVQTITSSIGDPHTNPKVQTLTGLHEADNESQGIVNIGDSNFGK